MKEYIEREALINDLSQSVVFSCRTEDAPKLRRDINKIMTCIKRQPTADVVEVKHGEWRDKDWSGIAVKGYMACSQCNVMIPRCEGTQYCLNYLYFCPKCGAKMDRKDK